MKIRGLSKVKGSLLFVAMFCGVAWAQGDGAEFKQPPLAETAAAPEGFVPKGWRLLGKAEGDLNGDGRADAVIVAGHDKENSEPDDTWEEPRLLVIALGEAQGGLRRSAVSHGVALCRGCGGVFGDPFESVSVERGAVVVSHYAGSRNRWSLVDRFRLQDGQWTHIGATEIHTDTLDCSYEEKRDANLSTGLVEETGRRGRTSYRRVFYEIRASRVERAPTIDGATPEGEWPGASVRLVFKENVVMGAAAWRGDEDASARVSAVFRGDDLYLRADVSDDSVTPGDAVRVISKTGQVVKPAETRTAARDKGYVVESRYVVKSLGIDEIEARLKELRGYGAGEETLPKDRVLRLTVEIVDEDAGQKTPSVLSTSRGGRKYPARLRLTPHAGLPLLSNFDREGSADVMPLTGLPEGDGPK